MLAALLDKNQDGKLSPAELRSALCDSGIEISEETLEELLRDLPGNKSFCTTSEEPELNIDSFAVSSYLLVLAVSLCRSIHLVMIPISEPYSRAFCRSCLCETAECMLCSFVHNMRTQFRHCL